MFKQSFTKKLAHLAAITSLGLSFAAHATPTNFSFAGTFAADDDIQLFNFTANGSSVVTLISYSYGGGTQANGNVVVGGGFDPILALFDSSGTLVAQNDDAISGTTGACGGGVVHADAVTKNEWDTCLTNVLAAGQYTVAVMQYDNFAPSNLSQTFGRVGDPNFTATIGNCSNGQFCDVSGNPNGNNRTNKWAFDVLNVEQATQVTDVPEPATLALIGVGLAGLGFSRRKRAN